MATNPVNILISIFVGANGQGYDQAALDRIFEETRNAAYEIIKRKKATYYAIDLGLRTIVEAVLRDQHTVLTVASPMHGQYGVSDISLRLPTIIGRRSVEAVLGLPMSDSEAKRVPTLGAAAHGASGRVDIDCNTAPLAVGQLSCGLAAPVSTCLG